MTAHRLNRLEVELRLDDEAHAHALIDRLSALRTTGIAPLLDRVFDAASPPGRLHRIDLLDLDLGHLPLDGFEQALLQRLEDALRRALAKALQHPSAARADADAARDWLEVRCRTGLLPWWAQASAAPPGAPDDDGATAAAAQQIQALRAGRGWLAWLASLADAPVALRRLAAIGGAAAIALDDDAGTAALQAAAAELAQRLHGAGSTQAGALASAHADALAGAAAPVTADLLSRADTPDGGLTDAAALAWRSALLTALARDGGRGVQAVIDTALRLLPSVHQQRLVAGAMLPARSPEAAAALDRLAAAGRGQAAQADGGLVAARASQPSAAPAASVPPPSLQPAPQAPALPPPSQAPSAVAADPGADPADPAAAADPGRARSAARRLLAAMDWIDVPDAGLVLLWPFIERLFQHCGLLTDTREFLDAGARTRGVLLLAQLSWPEPLPAEPRLALAKLLCGLEPDAPFEPDGPPTADEAEACAGLLAAALAHAATTMPALANTSVAGFQTVFVQRPGLLGARHGSWLLQRPRRPEDLLLDRLPWGWAWVRLPWMPHPLQVVEA